VKMNNNWWDGYCGQDTVIMDDFRATACPFDELLRVLDRYPLKVQMKGTSTELSASAFVLTTCHRPEVTFYAQAHENLDQVLRRITNIVEFLQNGQVIVWKGLGPDGELPINDDEEYVPLSDDDCVKLLPKGRVVRDAPIRF